MAALAYNLTLKPVQSQPAQPSLEPYLGNIGYVIAIVLALVVIGIFVYAARTMVLTINIQPDPSVANADRQTPRVWPLL
jgi:hypothetical protein